MHIFIFCFQETLSFNTGLFSSFSKLTTRCWSKDCRYFLFDLEVNAGFSARRLWLGARVPGFKSHALGISFCLQRYMGPYWSFICLFGTDRRFRQRKRVLRRYTTFFSKIKFCQTIFFGKILSPLWFFDVFRKGKSFLVSRMSFPIICWYPRLQESQILQNSTEILANFAFLTRTL